MDVVGAAFGDEGDLGAGGAAEIGVGTGGDDAELLDSVERDAEGGGEAGARVLIVGIDAVERDVRLIGLTAIYVAGAVTRRVVFAVVSYAGLEGKQANDIAAFEGELKDRLGGEVIAEGGVLGVNGIGLGRNGDGIGSGGEFEFDIARGRGLDLYGNAAEGEGTKAGGCGGERVGGWGELGERVISGAIGGGGAFGAGGSIEDRDRGAGDNGAGRIGDSTAQRGQCLPVRRHRRQQNEKPVPHA